MKTNSLKLSIPAFQNGTLFVCELNGVTVQGVTKVIVLAEAGEVTKVRMDFSADINIEAPEAQS